MKQLNQIFVDVHEINLARHYLTVMAADASAEIYRDLRGDFHRNGKDGSIKIDSKQGLILRALERAEIIVPAKKPEYFGNKTYAGYRMALAQN